MLNGQFHGHFRLLLVSIVLLSSAPSAAAIHDGLHEQIAAVTREIEACATNPELFVRRGELRRLHREWDEALADLRHARELDPRVDVWLAEARVHVDLGWVECAQLALERHLAARPGDPQAFLLRARLLEQRGKLEDAVHDYDRAIAGLDPPEPDHYLARADALAALGGVDRALSGIDAALARLGPASSLELRAVELESERGRFDDALARLELVAARSPRQERWLAERGEILLRAGRRAEALAAFRDSRRALEALPARHRTSELALELERSVARRLAELEAPACAVTEGR